MTDRLMWQRASALVHLLVSLGVGLVAAGIAGAFLGWEAAGLVGWVVAAGVFLAWTWAAIWPLDAANTKRLSRREEPSRVVRDAVLLAGAVGAAVVVALVVFRAQQVGPLRTIFAVACIAASWATVHTIFTLTYARLFYTDPVGGVDFSQDNDPTYQDFAYLGFTVGMTFQVSDTDIEQQSIRTTILRHALVSFMFGAIIIAVTINIVAGLSK